VASIVDPHIGFVSYQQALLDGSIRPTPCESHPELFVMHDEPEPGVQRLTYAFNSGAVSKAYAVYIQADFLNGKPCFGVGYATAEQFRNQGLATEIVTASLKELHQGMAPHLREPGFYVEAIVGTDNPASQKVASRTLSDSPDSIKDDVSGLPALHYVKLIV
jgi:hypothetical protein